MNRVPANGSTHRIGTVIAQAGAATWLCVVVVRGAKQHSASLRPDRPGIRAAASANVPLLARTLLEAGAASPG